MDVLIGFLVALFWLGFLVVAVVAVIALLYFNKLRRLKEDIKERQSNVRGSVKKMVDILNKVGDVVKGYKGFEQVTQLKVSQDLTTSGLASAFQQSNTMLSTVMAAADRFPDLKASGLFQGLMEDIRQCHNDIEYRGQEFNRAVTAYNVVRGGIPAVLFAGLLGFRKENHLQFDTGGIEEDVDTVREFNSNDEDRVEQLLSSAGTHLLGATKAFAAQAGQASKVLAAQAGATGKLMSERLKERAAAGAGQKYFYMAPGGVPRGPATPEEIRALVETGQLPGEATVAEVGTEVWMPLGSLLAGEPSE
jgi:LemA protein